MTEKQVAEEWIFDEIKYHSSNYEECGELNYTKLAKECANTLNIYEDEVEYKIPEWLFDMVIDVAEKFKE